MTQQVFRLRLKNAKGEIRQMSIAASSQEEAAAIALATEQKHVGFHLDADKLADLDKGFRAGTLNAADRQRLVSHHQDKPYSIVKAS